MHVTKVFTNHSFVHWKAVISEGCASVVQRQRLYGFHLWHRKGAITCACAGELQKKRYWRFVLERIVTDVANNVSKHWPGKVHVQDLNESLGSQRVCCKVWHGMAVKHGKTVFGGIMTSQWEFTLCSHPLLFLEVETHHMTDDSRREVQTPEFLCFDDPLQCSPCHLNVRDLKTNEPMAVSMEPCEAKDLDFEIIPFLIVVKSSQDRLLENCCKLDVQNRIMQSLLLNLQFPSIHESTYFAPSKAIPASLYCKDMRPLSCASNQ